MPVAARTVLRPTHHDQQPYVGWSRGFMQDAYERITLAIDADRLLCSAHASAVSATAANVASIIAGTSSISLVCQKAGPTANAVVTS